MTTMSFKRGKQPLTNDELLAQFDELNVGDTAAPAAADTQQKSEQALLDELENLASQRPASRPSTPRPSSTSMSPNQTSTATPPPGRSSEDKPVLRKSGDSLRPFHTGITPADISPPEV